MPTVNRAAVALRPGSVLLCASLTLLLLLLCAACGSTRGALKELPAASRFDGPSGLPDPQGAARAASDSLNYILGNYAQFAQHNFYESAGSTVDLLPLAETGTDISTASYGGFRIPVDDPGPLRLDFKWSIEPQTNQLYVGLGNFNTNRWDWQRPSDPAATILIDNYADYLDADAGLLLVLLLLPGPAAHLDLTTLQTRPETGWHYVECFSAERPDSGYNLRGDPFVYDGHPAAILRSWKQVNSDLVDPHNYLIYSSSATGDNAADWSTTELDFAPLRAAQIGSGVAMLHKELNDQSGLTELYYDYSAGPDQPFSKELLASSKWLDDARLAQIGGLPAVVYTATEEDAPQTTPIFYTSSSAVSGGTWTGSRIDPDREVELSLSGHFTDILELDGKPLLGYYGELQNPSQFIVASAGKLHPDASSDWSLAELGEGYDNVLWGVQRGGKPCLIALDFVKSEPDQDIFWTYELSGADPATPADWTVTRMDALNLGAGFDRPISFIAIGSELVFSRYFRYSSDFYLNGLLKQSEIWRSSSPANNEAAWDKQILERNQASFSGPFLVDVNGQPGQLRLFDANEGYTGDLRTTLRAVWGIYEP